MNNINNLQLILTFKTLGRCPKPLGAIMLMLMLSACASLDGFTGIDERAQEEKIRLQKERTAEFIKPIRPSKESAEAENVSIDTARYQTRITKGPGVNITAQVADVDVKDLGAHLKGDKISGNYNNIPLPSFINEVFGEQLALSFTLDPKLLKLKDLVTLRLTEPVSPSELFRVAQRTLAAYEVAISKQQDLYVFSVDKNIATGETPLLISGRTLPEVPPSHRPIFMFVPLEVVSNSAVKGWLASALKGKDIKVNDDPIRNAILLQGNPDLVRQALEIIKVLDQPLMRGKYSISIEPVFSKADSLARDLVEVLKSEGYHVSLRAPLGSIIILPLKGSNQIIAFASSKEILGHVERWVHTLDRKQPLGIDNGIFMYQVKNTQASHIVDMLNELGAVSSVDVKSKGSSGKGQFIVDSNRNAVVFKGSGQAWTEILPSVREMDQPSPSVLVEVILAEVTLNDQEATGVEFLAKSGDFTFKTLGGLGLGSSGLSMIFDSAGETRAVLNAFYENKRANIRSRPRLMVKSGQTASIDVGNEIPLITSTSQSTDNGDSPVIQTVEYRKTGVLLTIKPVVHSSGYVDIEVTQELSEAQQTKTSSIDSPSIFNRKIETTVTLKDGGSVLLGGVISESLNDTDNGVPFFGKLPFIGKLFSSNSNTQDRTELMMMIIPYVVKNPTEAEGISLQALNLTETDH